MVNITIHERYNNDPEKLFNYVNQKLWDKAYSSEIEKKRFKKWFMPRIIKHPLTFDTILLWHCYKLSQKIEKNNDATIVITGSTGSGKSTLSTQIICWIIPDFDRKNIITKLIDYVRIYRDRAVNIRNNMRLSGDVYRPPSDGLILDEGNEIRSDESMKKGNRQFRRIFTIQRFCKMLLIINIPFWHHLDKILRNSDSTDLLIHVLERGKYKGIIKNGIDTVEERNKKSVNRVTLSTKFFWHGYFGSRMPDHIGQYNYETAKIDSAIEEMDSIYNDLKGDNGKTKGGINEN